IETIHRKKSGELVPVEISINYILYNGRICHFGYFRDISERKKTEEALVNARIAAEEASRAKSEFLANMSHEIRTPMNAIMGFADILDKKITNVQEKKYLESIKSGSKLLLRLLNEILDLSKVEAGKIVLEYNYFNPGKTLDEIHRMFMHRAAEKDIYLKLNVSEEIPESIYLDEIRFRQIVINLVSNAIKFTGSGGVEISCSVAGINSEKEELDLTVSVRDTGVGISESEKENIFDAFSQQAGHSQKFGGTGLGLTISKRLANLMNGEIEVLSEMDQGSEFRVVFRSVHYTEGEFLDNVGDDNSERIRFEEACVLIVDDVKSNRDLIRGYFDHSGLNFIEAVNGKEGVESAEKYRPDIMIMDLRMPVMDGYEAVKKIKQIVDIKDIPIIIASASGMEKRMNEIESVIDGYLRKPFSKKDLAEYFKKFINFSFVEGIPEAEQGNLQIRYEDAEIPVNADAILRKLNGEAMKTCDAVCADLDFSEIKGFADKFKSEIKDYDYMPLLEWAENLKGAADMYDVDEIRKLSKKLHEIASSIGNKKN
ncbi:MAG: ATP-binding protein, partial [Spirochaetia bacterium]|nr:ATP-binding protein [Spirochaetia bacterium]